MLRNAQPRYCDFIHWNLYTFSGIYYELIRRRTTHSELWINENECKYTKEAFPDLNTRLTTKTTKSKSEQTTDGSKHDNRALPIKKHLFSLGITDSPLCRACMEADETPTYVLLRCRGVAEQRAAYIGSPASLPEALGDLGGLLSFWS
ncbi:jg6440 [Pararge aegeria aegeria]|uniref:Jg6440 protein n=1 Tax=Pararge aegeria aegeria TaxID=348720 RepID=A0A8S4RSK2_9NEOP|nr:jg6440 [Pararge aegeria aegeria]